MTSRSDRRAEWLNVCPNITVVAFVPKPLKETGPSAGMLRSLARQKFLDIRTISAQFASDEAWYDPLLMFWRSSNSGAEGYGVLAQADAHTESPSSTPCLCFLRCTWSVAESIQVAQLAGGHGKCDDAVSIEVRFVRGCERAVFGLLDKSKDVLSKGFGNPDATHREDRHNIEIAFCWAGVDCEIRMGCGQLSLDQRSVLEEWVGLIDNDDLDQEMPTGTCVVSYKYSIWDYFERWRSSNSQR